MLHEPLLRTDHVADRNYGKIKVIRLAGIRVDTARAGGAGTAADDIAANDKIAVRIEGFAGSHHVIPPAGFLVFRGVLAGEVCISGQSVFHEDGVIFCGRESSVSFITDHHIFQAFSAIQPECGLLGLPEGKIMPGNDPCGSFVLFLRCRHIFHLEF